MLMNIGALKNGQAFTLVRGHDGFEAGSRFVKRGKSCFYLVVFDDQVILESIDDANLPNCLLVEVLYRSDKHVGLIKQLPAAPASKP